MSAVLNESSVIWHFKHSDAIKICDGITFDFYTGLSVLFPDYQYGTHTTGLAEGLGMRL